MAREAERTENDVEAPYPARGNVNIPYGDLPDDEQKYQEWKARQRQGESGFPYQLASNDPSIAPAPSGGLPPNLTAPNIAPPQPQGDPNSYLNPPPEWIAAEQARREATAPTERALQSGIDYRKYLLQHPVQAPPDPKLQNVPQAPNLQYRDAFQVFQAPAVLLATLGSLMTRRPAVNALTAGAAALNGYMEGDQAKVAREEKNWLNAVNQVEKQNKVELERYQAAWKRTDLSVANRAAMLEGIAASVKDENMLAAIRSGSAERVQQFIDARIKGQEGIETAKARSIYGNMNPADIEENAKAIANYQQAPPTGFAARSPAAQQMMAAVYRINPDYDAKKYGAQAAAAKVVGTAEQKADAAALSQLVKTKNAIEQFENTAIKNGRVLVDLAKKVDKTGVPVIERWVRAGRQATGDPEVAKFHAQWLIFNNEAAKILTNPNMTGVLTDTARREMQESLPYASAWQQIKAVVDLLEGDFGRRSSAIDEQIGKIKGSLKGGGTSQLGGSPPVDKLKEGFETTFGNGQTWTLKNGVPVQVR